MIPEKVKNAEKLYQLYRYYSTFSLCKEAGLPQHFESIFDHWKIVKGQWTITLRDLPVVIPRKFAELTCDKDYLYFFKDDQFSHPYVGSAEQSFIARMGLLEPGQIYKAVTPCFRKEYEDATHQQVFWKAEAFIYQPYVGQAMELANFAYDTFKIFAPEGCEVRLVANAEPSTGKAKKLVGWDVEVNGIEVGSYARYSYDGREWACGTIIAEPRFTYATDLIH